MSKAPQTFALLRTRLINKKIIFFKIYYPTCILLAFIFSVHYIYGQDNKLTRKDDYTSLYLLNSDKNKGFEVSVSAILMFTSGAADRNGLRWGVETSISKNIGDFKIITGFDLYKAKQKFGLGTTFTGVKYDDGQYGFSYYVNKYHQGDRQVSGILGLHSGEFQIRFEDDILALPFTGFVIYDRYRTAALEFRYRNFLFGTNVYTNEVNGLIDVSHHNSKGIYYTGKQISSPIYIGYTNKNLLLRYGLNNKTGGYWGQNWWHRLFFDTSDYNYGSYNNHFLQIGVDKPYTLY